MTATPVAGARTGMRAARRRPGRPRNEEIDSQVLTATMELIDEYEEVTAARIVERSGVSRAALYRRWPSLTVLIAAALDVGREIPPAIPLDGNLSEAILMAFLGGTKGAGQAENFEERSRQRIRLAMADRELQKAYWSSHVSLRRIPIVGAINSGIEQGVLRPDLDAEACFDLLAGVFYYQIVVRGEHINDEGTQARCRAALDVAWRGMLPGQHH